MTDLNLLWVTKANSGSFSKTDVSITLNKNGDNKEQYAFRFRNNSFLRFTKNDFMEFAVTGTRIYFRESNEKHGFKLGSPSQDGKNKSVKTVVNLDKFIGDYELLWDSLNKLNYIDVAKKITQKDSDNGRN